MAPPTCVILAAGYNSTLEQEIQASDAHAHLKGLPKALLPVGGWVGGRERTVLDVWWDDVKERRVFCSVYLVVNAAKYKYYERWATSADFPLENIVNNGATTEETGTGAVGDFHLAVQTRKIKGDVIVIAGDMLRGEEFDIGGVQQFFNHVDGDLCIYYDIPADAAPQQHTQRGMLTIDNTNKKVTDFQERPQEYPTRHASVVFYCLKEATCQTDVPQFLAAHPLHPAQPTKNMRARSFGGLLGGLAAKGRLYGMKVNSHFQLVGNRTTLKEYLQVVGARGQALPAQAQSPAAPRAARRAFTERAYARVGLLGNPSDGFHGKTISLTIKNFWAEVAIEESNSLRLLAHPVNDPGEFGRLADLHSISRKEGYVGGMRLMQASCKKFYDYCCAHGIALPKRNFTMSYDTNIPRQVGLAGSSCIVTCCMKALMHFYGIELDVDIPKRELPSLILSVETEELRIAAGLQDRVVQVYEGLVYMDFSKEILERNQGCGEYETISAEQLPPLFLLYASEPSDSGRIHSNVKDRWLQGDAVVVRAMQAFGSFASEGKAAVLSGDHAKLGSLMDANFNLRRELYTDACLGDTNLRMIELARSFGAHVKFPGSGGATVGMLDDPSRLGDLQLRAQEQGFVCVPIVPHTPA
eukprot:TRINITY_DN13546_c0_g1_i1.p1 TRINITY_DN13546_c0_g1~~TRINITY_DN13546_c0_g1_i1.p1  ORF type:complete len:685 (+),score=267.27 TRINITY_DN13546_c0_g1_i1:138-2057(+)